MHKKFDKYNAILEMNRLGSEKIPFLFIIDFELENPEIFELTKLDSNIVLFDVDGVKNCNFNEDAFPGNLYFEKHPITKETYAGMFNNVIRNINIGNTYLLNLTASTPIKINLTLKEVFHFSKAKYKLYYSEKFVCFSPETFITIKDNKISSYPMKGTIDASILNAEQIILEDEKETAEHYTIVDLIRNDLGIVSKNVRVEKFRYFDKIKTNSNELLQVSSVITGDLENDYNCKIGDILFSLLPAGSITGAPKKKTTEIILQTETHKRGYYTGVFGIFDGTNLNSAVLIRFIENTNECLVYKSGGGITSFSKLDSEYQEMIDKVYVPIIRNN